MSKSIATTAHLTHRKASHHYAMISTQLEVRSCGPGCKLISRSALNDTSWLLDVSPLAVTPLQDLEQQIFSEPRGLQTVVRPMVGSTTPSLN